MPDFSDALNQLAATDVLAGRTALDSRIKVLQKDDTSLFIPQRLESVKFEGKMIQAYPFLGPDALASERDFALMCNRKAAENAFLGPQQIITFAASRNDLDTHARVATSQWTCRLLEHWADPAFLTVLGYYGSKGDLIDAAIDAATGALKPIDDGTADSRRPAGCWRSFRQSPPHLGLSRPPS
jgi:hypothetical protein